MILTWEEEIRRLVLCVGFCVLHSLKNMGGFVTLEEVFSFYPLLVKDNDLNSKGSCTREHGTKKAQRANG